MNRRVLPKPVEGWASVTLDGRDFMLQPEGADEDLWSFVITREEVEEWGPQIRVRIVPITPKPRTKRKEKKK